VSVEHLTNLRYLNFPVYWSPQDRTLSYADPQETHLIAMSPIASREFARLVDAGVSLTDITNSDLAVEIGRHTGAAR
jgi:hypothetical protein